MPNFDLAPDGKRFVVFEAAEPDIGRVHVTMLLNFFDELRGRRAVTAQPPPRRRPAAERDTMGSRGGGVGAKIYPVLALALCAGNAVAQGGKSSDWMVVRDTRENAFSIEVPKGWKISGGAYRLGANNPRFLVDMTSPDGHIDLRVGDSAVPAFSVPRMRAQEGQRYSTGVDWGILARYLPGKDFAVTYAQGRFHGTCQDLQLKSSSQLSPVLAPEREVIARTPQGEVVNTTSAGEALFRGVANGQEMAAYVWAETTLTTSNFSDIRNWAVTGLVSFLAPRAQAPAARRMLEYSARSFTLSPDWIARQASLSRQSSAAVLKQTQELVASQQQRFERLDAERHRQSMQMDDIINGVQWTTDSSTGQHREAPLGPNPNYFYNPNTGATVNSTFRPGNAFDWHNLTPTAR
jgi:hypothetical protein